MGWGLGFLTTFPAESMVPKQNGMLARMLEIISLMMDVDCIRVLSKSKVRVCPYGWDWMSEMQRRSTSWRWMRKLRFLFQNVAVKMSVWKLSSQYCLG